MIMPLKSSLIQKFLLLLLVFFCLACSVKTPDDYENPKSLFERGQSLMDKKSYSEAALHFENLENRFPESDLAIKAELLKCDAYFLANKYIEAEYAYNQFKKFHPKHEKIAYVTLQIGKAQLKQASKDAERDQSYTQSSISYFNEVIRQYPGTDAAETALELQTQAQKRLYQLELYVGQFYLKEKEYTAALGRLLPLLENHTFPKLHQEAQYKSALTYYKLNQFEQSKEILNSTDTTAINGKYSKKIRSLKTKLKKK